MKKGKYLITGSAGFIGSHLVRKISSEYDIVLVDDLSRGSLKFIPNKYKKRLIKKKVQDLHKVNIKRLKGIFHLAAQSSVPFSLKNLNEINDSDIILDIGSKTVEIISKIIDNSKTILWNGPAGYFEIDQFSKGSNEIAKKIAALRKQKHDQDMAKNQYTEYNR